MKRYIEKGKCHRKKIKKMIENDKKNKSNE